MGPKYKAWHTGQKKMFSAEQMGKDQMTLSPDGKGFINVSGASTKLSVYMTHLIPLQYTIFHDQNGIEIYEDDILKFCVFDHNDNDTHYRGIVKFSEGQWQLWNQIDSEYYGSDGAFPLYWTHRQDDTIEVIGNIYENLELLKEGK